VNLSGNTVSRDALTRLELTFQVPSSKTFLIKSVFSFGSTPSANSQYIYAPHLAPESVQQKANCIIGKDYPAPMLDEQVEKGRCIARIKNAYTLHLQGDAPEVLDGTAADKLRKLHEESGASKSKSSGEVKEEKGRAKRERDGDQSIDGFFQKGKKSKKA
jgi:hypothetical protein